MSPSHAIASSAVVHARPFGDRVACLAREALIGGSGIGSAGFENVDRRARRKCLNGALSSRTRASGSAADQRLKPAAPGISKGKSALEPVSGLDRDLGTGTCIRAYE